MAKAKSKPEFYLGQEVWVLDDSDEIFATGTIVSVEIYDMAKLFGSNKLDSNVFGFLYKYWCAGILHPVKSGEGRLRNAFEKDIFPSKLRMITQAKKRIKRRCMENSQGGLLEPDMYEIRIKEFNEKVESSD